MKRVREDDDASSGIGDMIMFIATVLVAAMAASTFIAIAEQVTEQAETTGQQALTEVATRYEVVAMLADYNEWGEASGQRLDQVQRLQLLIRLGPGSPPANLSSLIITVTGQDGAATLTWDSAATNATEAGANNYALTLIQDSSGEFPNGTIVRGDLLQVDILVGNNGSALDLDLAEELDVTLVPGRGSTTTASTVLPHVQTTRFAVLS